MGDFVCLSIEEHQKLVEDSLFLNCLRNAGVDNWEGYDYAIEDYYSITEEGEY